MSLAAALSPGTPTRFQTPGTVLTWSVASPRIEPKFIASAVTLSPGRTLRFPEMTTRLYWNG